MTIGAKEAARLVGKSKQTIVNAINSGKISAVKGIDGSYQIEPVELFRVFVPVSSMGVNGNGKLDDALHQFDSPLQLLDSPSVDTLQVEVKLLRELLDSKDDVIAAKDDTIMDLRSRLNVEQEERRRLSMMLTAQPQAQPQPQPHKSMWARFFGGH